MSLDQYDNLTLEQKFAQASFIQVVKKMTIEQSKYFLIELHRSMIVKENNYKSMLKATWFSDLQEF